MQSKGPQLDKAIAEKEEMGIIVKSMAVRLSLVEELWNKFSLWNRLLRVVAWCLRFIGNSRKSKILSPYLKTRELNQAHKIIIKAVQSSECHDEITRLESRSSLNVSNKLYQLSLFFDEDGLVRVGERLKNANLPEETKYPLILPKSNHITNLLINYYHLKYLHAGSQLMHSALHQNYWIIGVVSNS
ncbi:uncharacterized protein LOC118186128 [Stegodyphus dumicola]|uniref:uncharacterized protein LOC118186128 n=1 Tax=Stegodyphus dumicola TaxID=202533 RepID=UPI0015AA0F7D|nr:uncharacterized protein LOC118186128 [Stegodyphus dumicola]